MKLPSKYIALLVILSLTGIFAYQAYWLTGLYQTMRSDIDRSIVEAMRISDYNEMMMRVEKMRQKSEDDKHGSISVSAGYGDSGKAIIRTQTSETYEDSAKNIVNSSTQTSHQETVEVSVTNDDDEAQSALVMTNDMNMTKNSMLELATYFQKGLHAGLDVMYAPDIAVYDSLLALQLTEQGILLPYRLEHLYTGKTDSLTSFIDTLAVRGTVGYTPHPEAMQYNYSFDLHSHQVYRLTIEDVSSMVLQQMQGILITSFIILLILSFSFGFLIRTILRQKTLEEMKSDFTNNITHELKTPIAVAYAANDALLNFNQAEEKTQRDRYLGICQEQLQRLSGLVEQILSMSMERRKTFRLHPEELSLHSLLDPLIEQHKLKAAKPVHITVDIEPKDLTVFADRTHFGNILSNLIDNAIKYSQEEAEIRIRCRTTSNGQGKWTEISVSDHGIGIATDKLQHIFDKFYRVPTGNLHNVKGYGLGLFYVKTMTEQHGGTIKVKSEPGKGSSFVICLKEG